MEIENTKNQDKENIGEQIISKLKELNEILDNLIKRCRDGNRKEEC